MDERELTQRLGRLACLALPTRQTILEAARDRSAHDGIAERLAFVEQRIAAIDHAAFQQLCKQMSALKTLPELLTALKVKQDADELIWMKSAVQLQLDSVRCLYCLANHFASPVKKDADTP